MSLSQKLPYTFTQRMQQQLDAENYQKFLESYNNPAPTSIRLNPNKQNPNFNHLNPINWCQLGKYMPKRPIFTLDPLLHAGTYYVQEASSMFLHYVIQQLQLSKQPLILDLCAAPGGKTTLLQAVLPPNSLIIANEVIKARANILTENVVKWGCHNVVVTQNDPENFLALAGMFDIVLVDAPCSGEGLFRKNKEAINEWSEKQVAFCAARQKRILQAAQKLVKPNGYLIYSTCTFAESENEHNVKYICQQNNNFLSVPISTPKNWQVLETQVNEPTLNTIFSYRFYPHLTNGEGFFISCLQNKQTLIADKKLNNKNFLKLTALTKQQVFILNNWFLPSIQTKYISYNDNVVAIPELWSEIIALVFKNLRVAYAGTFLGKIIANNLVPNHALAVSYFKNNNILSIEVEENIAIKFLQRKDIELETTIFKSGWILLTHKNQGIGFIKYLSNRINNYYPKEWKILMESK